MWLALCRAINWSRVDAVQHGVHDRPLRRGGLPAALASPPPAARPRRRGRGPRAARRPSMKTRLQTISPGLADALERAAAEPEVHRRLALAGGARRSRRRSATAGPTRRSRTPRRISAVRTSSPQRTSCSVVAGSRPIAVQTRLVTSASRPAHSSTSLKCGSGLPVVQHRGAPSRLRHRRALDVVQQPLDQVATPGSRSFSPCWYWMPIGVAAEVVGDPQRRRCTSCTGSRICASVSSVASSVPVRNVMPRRVQPGPDGLRLGVGHRAHLRVRARTGCSRSLKMPSRVEQLVVDDRVVHPHAALVEDAHDGLLALQLARPARRPSSTSGPPARLRAVAHVAGVVGDLPGRPASCRRPSREPVVGEVLAPQRASRPRPPWSASR